MRISAMLEQRWWHYEFAATCAGILRQLRPEQRKLPNTCMRVAQMPHDDKVLCGTSTTRDRPSERRAEVPAAEEDMDASEPPDLPASTRAALDWSAPTGGSSSSSRAAASSHGGGNENRGEKRACGEVEQRQRKNHAPGMEEMTGDAADTPVSRCRRKKGPWLAWFRAMCICLTKLSKPQGSQDSQ